MRPVSFASFLMTRVVWQSTRSFLRPRSRANFCHISWLWHGLDDREIGRGKRLVSYLRVQTGCGAHRISTPNVTAVFIFIFLCSIRIVHFVEFYCICPTNARHMKLYVSYSTPTYFNPLNPELNPICYLLALLGAYNFLHVSRIRVKLLTFRRLMSYIYIYIYIYIWSTYSWCF